MNYIYKFKVFREVYAIDAYAIQRFDELEDTRKGHYARHSIRLRLLKMGEEENVLESQVYFVANRYTPQMWMKTRHNCLSKGGSGAIGGRV